MRRAISFEPESPSPWQRMRGMLIFAVACITSPCCTPLIMPFALTLLAGTPVAIWLSAYIGWVYGMLTLASIISFVLGFRWLGQKRPTKHSGETRNILRPVSTEIKLS